MKAHMLLYWILAWLQLRRAVGTSLAVKLWCDPPASWASRHLDVTTSQHSEAAVDRVYVVYRQKIEAYCVKQCCRLGNHTCNIGVVQSGSKSAQCLLYGSYSSASCSFKRTDEATRCDIASTHPQSKVTTAPATTAPSTSNSSTATTTDATGTTARNDVSATPPSSTAAARVTVIQAAVNLPEKDASWQPVLKHKASGVKPRKGVGIPEAFTAVSFRVHPPSTTVQDVFEARTSTSEPETRTPKHTVASTASTSTTPVTPEVTSSTTLTLTTTIAQRSSSPTTLATVPFSKPITQVPLLWETMLNPVSMPRNIEETTVEPDRSTQKPQNSTVGQSRENTDLGKHEQHASVSSPALTSLAVGRDPEASTPMGLIVGLSVGLIFIFVVMGLVGRQILELWQKRHYSRMDFLVDGMYHVT